MEFLSSGLHLRTHEERHVQVVRGTGHLEAPLGPVLTIGNFDGLHRGHQALIERTRALGREVGAPAAALTFHPSPQEVLRPHSASPRLQSLEQRVRRFAATGLDFLIVEPFTSELATLPPPEFASRYLEGRIGVRGLVLGHDFRFGRGRAGSVESLREHLSVPIVQLSAVLQDGIPVSSSRIRAALASGAVAEASHLLGRSHEIEGTVRTGDQRGRTLGFPTANLGDIEGMLPSNGVYAVRVSFEDAEVAAVANIGTRPTFEGQEQRVELHLLDFDGDLYGTPLRVSLVARLRDEQRFDDADALVKAIQSDIEVAREHLA